MNINVNMNVWGFLTICLITFCIFQILNDLIKTINVIGVMKHFKDIPANKQKEIINAVADKSKNKKEEM